MSETTTSNSDPILETIETAESALTGLTPGLGSVATIAKAADDISSPLLQAIDSAEKDKPINEANDRRNKYKEISNETNPTQHAVDLCNYVDQLCTDAGHPAGELSGGTRRVPNELLTSLINGNIELIQLKQQIAQKEAHAS